MAVFCCRWGRFRLILTANVVVDFACAAMTEQNISRGEFELAPTRVRWVCRGRSPLPGVRGCPRSMFILPHEWDIGVDPTS